MRNPLSRIYWTPRLVGTLLLLLTIGVALVVPRPAPATCVELALTPLPAPSAGFDWEAWYGWASWYGKPFHGRKTASGTTYDMDGFSVAHKTLPLGTFVVIQNIWNNRWCVAIVNDRGPYVDGRDWDVSAAVAKRLGMVWHGVVPVKVRVINGY